MYQTLRFVSLAAVNQSASQPAHEPLDSEQPMLSVQFFSLAGKFTRVGEARLFATEREALEAVRAYAEPAGYTRISVADDADDDCVRFTGRTPGGRVGRNIAMGDWTAPAYMLAGAARSL